VWLKINLWDDIITLHVIEEKAFQASIKPPQASAMKAALDKDGHIALDIHFDFDKATLRPDAAPVIAQVLALLKDNPDLKLSIEGNTDNVGEHDYNVKLSQDRAAAVVGELVKNGIDATRLTSAGNGPDKPVADNDTTAGRAKNRRVELVRL
jgi:outer membrane protein OmpA-like peptidoglycan-associated protein